MLNLAGVIVNHLRVCLNLVCPTSPDGGACSLRDERSRRRSFPVGSERKRSIWLSLPHFISVTQHNSSSSKWPYYPQEAGCSQYIRGKRQLCGCFSLSLCLFCVSERSSLSGRSKMLMMEIWCSHILVKPNLGGLWVRPIGNWSSYDLILGKEAFALAWTCVKPIKCV